MALNSLRVTINQKATAVRKSASTIKQFLGKGETERGEAVLINISQLKCIGCGTCVISCPTYALSVACDTFQCQVDRDLCNDCLECLDYCPTDAIEEA